MEKTLSDFIAQAGRIVAFTGAGISTESGIPDYRSPGGIWSKMEPIQFQDFVASEEVRLEDWRRRLIMIDQFRAAKPAPGHLALARLFEDGKLQAVITQNIDGLHARSGIPEDRIIELHGNGTYATCLDCGRRHEMDWAREIIGKDAHAPRCLACGGLVKAAVINFGQAMPERELVRAQQMTITADLFLAIGSSLQVYPAAGLVPLAKEHGVRILIANRESTPLDPYADCVFLGEIGSIFRCVFDGAQS